MPTGNSVNANSVGLARYDGAGTWSGVTLTQNAVLIGGASNDITSLVLTDGQLAIGSTGLSPVAATLTAGTGVTITNGAGAITIEASGGGLSWVDVTGTSDSMAVNTGYLANNAGLVTLTLPATAAQFSVLEVKGYGAGGWMISQNANQQIRFGSATATTVGVGGSLASTNLNDGVRLLATVGGASTIWSVTSSIGNITIV